MPIHNSILLDASGQPSAEALVRTGAVLNVAISVHPALAASLDREGRIAPAPLTGLALIDTGATMTAIDHNVASQLDLAPVGIIQTGTAGGRMDCFLYPVRITFPDAGLPGADLTHAAGCDLAGQGYLALIGRDLLANFVLTYNGPLGQIILAH